MKILGIHIFSESRLKSIRDEAELAGKSFSNKLIARLLSDMRKLESELIYIKRGRRRIR